MFPTKRVSFYLGDELHSVHSDDITAETTLNEYLREKLHLTGTKKMCLEGGCGTCIVAVEEVIDGKTKIFAINSCLVSILQCQGWKINTIEGIGNPVIGYNPLQKLLADNNGSQCGFCSAGMIMNMYALQKTGPSTKLEIENSFGGNICRCTGYRPIMEAFKKLASDADEVYDIEDLGKCIRKQCTLTKHPDFLSSFYVELDGDSRWVKVHNLTDLMRVLRQSVTNNYMLVAGNTARGVYRPAILPELYIDITSVEELTKFVVTNTSLQLGANLSLTRTMEIFYEIAKDRKQFSFLSDMADHIDLVATVPVRNIGTIAGNLMIKYAHNEFPSDIFLILETVGAILTIVDMFMNETRMTPADFLRIDMTKRVIKTVTINALDDTYKYTSYKIMPRAQNAHAMVNAGFLFKISNNTVNSARIVYGGINPQFIHARNSEGLIIGKNLFDNNVLQQVYATLNNELIPDYVLPDPTPQYRKNLAIALFYKYALKIAPYQVLASKNISGGTNLVRPVSSSIQEFGTEKEKWPVSKPVIKVEALAQTSGQARYIDDIPNLPGQLFAAFVTAKATANSYIIGVDPSQALNMKGVVAFYDKNDIPGENNFTPKLMGSFPVQEEIFCSGRVQYYDQPVGVIVADNQDLAWRAASMVKVNYKGSTVKPFLNVKDVLKAQAKDRITSNTTVVAKSKGTDVKKVVKGDFYINWQYHYHMEVQCCNVVPVEDGLNVFASTQWMDSVQIAIAAALKLPMNKINVIVRRLGGSFGAKILRNALISVTAALAAQKLQRPVRMWMPFEANMDIIGRRYPLYVTYEVGVNGSGVFQYLDADLYTDLGVGGNEPIDPLVVQCFENCYNMDTWNFTTYSVVTDTAANCYTRAPGTVEGMAAIENIMDHVAYEINLDPISVKIANLNQTKYPTIPGYWTEIRQWAEIETRQRQIKEFNDANRWKKRGISVVPLVWTLEIPGNFTALVSIFHGDGTVVISHGGIEMGQGINTKACQVCAYKLGISLEYVQTKPSYCVISPNSTTTGGSLTSEAVCYAVIQACDVLLARMKPIRDKMTNPTWVDLVNSCFAVDVNLNASGFYFGKAPGIQAYDIFAIGATEVEIDVLTGEKLITKVEIIEDVGDSMSPLIDIGQVEGAFVMGIGYYTTEEIIFNDQGALQTNRTWTYKPPGAKDIPIDFKIRFPKNNPNPVGILQSKAIAEPPMCLSVTVPLAIRNAVASARKDSDSNASQYFLFDGPTTVEKTFLNSLNSFKQYTL